MSKKVYKVESLTTLNFVLLTFDLRTSEVRA